MDALLFDPSLGRYCDGLCSDVAHNANHTALHASIFPLAFDLVAAARVDSTVRWIRRRGMACSMYGAFPLLEALFGAGSVDRNTSYTATTASRVSKGRPSMGVTKERVATGDVTEGGVTKGGVVPSYVDYGASAVALMTSCQTGEDSDVG